MVCDGQMDGQTHGWTEKVTHIEVGAPPKKMFSENQQLHNKIKALYYSQEENQIEINKLAQYNRQSFMLELSDILQQDDENVIDIVVAGICSFDVNQIDIAHIVLEKGTTPIIVLFNRKADTTNFYRQKNNQAEPTILLNVIMMVIVIVKLVFQALSKKIASSV